MIRTSSVWRLTPVFEKIERKCARAVLRRMLSRSEASSRDKPLASSRARPVSAGVRLYSCAVTVLLASDLPTASRTYTTTVGLPLPSTSSWDGTSSTTTPRLTCPDGRDTDIASAPWAARLPCRLRRKALRTSRPSSRLSLG
ncbi:hypothetical protein D3C80_1442060 [compost metagenome]